MKKGIILAMICILLTNIVIASPIIYNFTSSNISNSDVFTAMLYDTSMDRIDASTWANDTSKSWMMYPYDDYNYVRPIGHILENSSDYFTVTYAPEKSYDNNTATSWLGHNSISEHFIVWNLSRNTTVAAINGIYFNGWQANNATYFLADEDDNLSLGSPDWRQFGEYFAQDNLYVFDSNIGYGQYLGYYTPNDLTTSEAELNVYPAFNETRRAFPDSAFIIVHEEGMEIWDNRSGQFERWQNWSEDNTFQGGYLLSGYTTPTTYSEKRYDSSAASGYLLLPTLEKFVQASWSIGGNLLSFRDDKSYSEWSGWKQSKYKLHTRNFYTNTTYETAAPSLYDSQAPHTGTFIKDVQGYTWLWHAESLQKFDAFPVVGKMYSPHYNYLFTPETLTNYENRFGSQAELAESGAFIYCVQHACLQYNNVTDELTGTSDRGEELSGYRSIFTGLNIIEMTSDESKYFVLIDSNDNILLYNQDGTFNTSIGSSGAEYYRNINYSNQTVVATNSYSYCGSSTSCINDQTFSNPTSANTWLSANVGASGVDLYFNLSEPKNITLATLHDHNTYWARAVDLYTSNDSGQSYILMDDSSPSAWGKDNKLFGYGENANSVRAYLHDSSNYHSVTELAIYENISVENQILPQKYTINDVEITDNGRFLYLATNESGVIEIDIENMNVTRVFDDEIVNDSIKDISLERSTLGYVLGASTPVGASFIFLYDTPEITQILPTLDEITGASPSFNFSVISDADGTTECSLYIDGILNSTLSGINDGEEVSLNATSLFSVGDHEWSIYCEDSLELTSSSMQKNFSVDGSGPSASNISYYPSENSTIDPGTNVTINVSVIDEYSYVSSVFLRYNNGSWHNISMLNITPSIYQAVVELNDSLIYNFTIWSNDSNGNYEESENFSIASLWDCNWSVLTTDMGDSFGWDEYVNVANITIINDGDPLFANNCTIDFQFNHNIAPASRIDFDWSGIKYKVFAQSNETLEIDYEFFDSMASETLNVEIVDEDSLSITPSINVSGTMQSVNAPYLSIAQENKSTNLSSHFDTSGSNIILYLTPQIANINYSIRNGVGNDTPEGTAYNVTFNWSIPETFSLSMANGDYLVATLTVATSSVSATYLNISDGDVSRENHSVNVVLELPSTGLEDLNETTICINHTASGDYLNGTPMLNTSGGTIFSNQLCIELRCYSGVDGIVVAACDDADGDYEEEAIIINNNQEEESSSGGGGGGAGNSVSINTADLTDVQREALFQTSEIYELVRGDNQTFTLTVENAFNGRMDEVTMELSGFLDQYIDISPKTYKTIGINDTLEYTVSINAPEYFTEGNYELLFVIRGVINNTKEFGNRTLYRYSPIQEQRTIELYIVPISRSDAEGLITNSNTLLSDLDEHGYNTIKLVPLFDKLNSYLDERNYQGIIDTEDQISELHNLAFKSSNMINEIRMSMDDANDRGIITSETERLLLLANAALDRGEFKLAMERANDAELSIALETVGKFNVLNFIKRNWHLLLLSFVALLCIMFIFAISLRYFLLQEKLKVLHKESHVVLGLIKESQIECFEKGKLSMEEYMETITEYETRLNKIVQAIITNETTLANLTKFLGNEEKRLVDEKERILKLMKETQIDYIDTKKLETRAYENRMHTYQERLAEIEEKLITMEADRAMRHSHKGSNHILASIFSYKKKSSSFFKKANYIQKIKKYFIGLSRDITKWINDLGKSIVGSFKRSKLLKMKIPKINVPRISLPKIRTPKFNLQKISTPKISHASAEVGSRKKTTMKKPMSHREEMLHNIKKAYKHKNTKNTR
ncbi:hypothetical protein H6503_06530 [Candidatus Woesearchaeota archaeon]|nr:hypothetical protein [Candidatus Woesearchaeota archaeon]